MKNPTVTFGLVGTYRFRVQVTDNRGGSDVEEHDGVVIPTATQIQINP